jgi:hypothetical protein
MPTGHCAYHFCHEHTELDKCPHCERSFCNKHIQAAAPFIGDIHANSPDARIAKAMSGYSHPCAKYVDYKRERDAEEWEKYGHALDGVSGRKHAKVEIKETVQDKNTNGSITIQLLGNTNNSIYVELSHYGDKVTGKKTNNKGRAYFPNLRPGQYTATVVIGKQRHLHSIKLQSKENLETTFTIPTEVIKKPLTEKPVAYEDGVHATAIKNTKEETRHEREEAWIMSPQIKVALVVAALIVAVGIVIKFYPSETAIPVSAANISNETASFAQLVIPDTPNEVLDYNLYLSDKSSYRGKPASVRGYLKQYTKGSGTSGVIVQVAIDDNGNELPLFGLTREQKALFVAGEKSAELFTITGTFAITTDGFGISVSSITSQ